MPDRKRRSTDRRTRRRKSAVRGRPTVIHHRLQQEAARERLAWYAGLAIMGIFEFIEWPVALVIGLGHEIAHRTRDRALRELAEGIEAGS